VADEDGVPMEFTWHGETHPVHLIANQWRIDEGWWDKRIYRDYFKLTTTTGLLLIVYRDGLSGEWYLQRLYN
jgi:hypothetical protein